MAKVRNTVGRARDQFKTIGNTPIGKVISQYTTNQINKMKEQLSSRRSTGSLASSLDFKMEARKDGGIVVYFYAEDYWDFINSGVDGVSVKGKAVTNQFGKTYSFKHINPSKSMVNAFTGTTSMRGWMASKNITSIRWKDKDGNDVVKQLSTENDFRSAAFVLARATKIHGIRRTPFVDNTFTDKSIEKLQDDIYKALDKMIE